MGDQFLTESKEGPGFVFRHGWVGQHKFEFVNPYKLLDASLLIFNYKSIIHISTKLCGPCNKGKQLIVDVVLYVA